MSRTLKWQHSEDARSGGARRSPSVLAAPWTAPIEAAFPSTTAAEALPTMAATKGAKHRRAAPEVNRSEWKDLERQAASTPKFTRATVMSGRTVPGASFSISSQNIGNKSKTTRCIAVSARKRMLTVITWNAVHPVSPKRRRVVPLNVLMFKCRPARTSNIRDTSVVTARMASRARHRATPQRPNAKGNVRTPVPIAVAARFTAAESGVPRSAPTSAEDSAAA
mmetsp:Transcript_33453/g.73195  ORF Transcript_33453/g.73195 Transcript_33453/m.73195 type:complete len:223 (-) Transcript_33453:213-881(-)